MLAQLQHFYRAAESGIFFIQLALGETMRLEAFAGWYYQVVKPPSLFLFCLKASILALDSVRVRPKLAPTAPPITTPRATFSPMEELLNYIAAAVLASPILVLIAIPVILLGGAVMITGAKVLAWILNAAENFMTGFREGMAKANKQMLPPPC